MTKCKRDDVSHIATKTVLPKEITLAALKREFFGLGLSVKKTNVDKYRVTYRPMPPNLADMFARYANDKADALAVGVSMAEWRDKLDEEGLRSNYFDVPHELIMRERRAKETAHETAKAAILAAAETNDWGRYHTGYHIVGDFALSFDVQFYADEEGGDYHAIAVYPHKHGRIRTDIRVETFEKEGGKWRAVENYNFTDRSEFDLSQGDWSMTTGNATAGTCP